ncbi:MAG: hypothetical protein HOB17_01100 [Candidatus Marinimicrobia bacterium]|nr:hypothetical protein [Candidatus Neomarinimicrobiota bacterium]MBT3634821.1 hypothetical protein [Candidatus Neomarinimicrobiota bacterium]MBT3683565.1 hypothetical protein [Candidatus Neomarinimicrobiota bacterium]MBT3760474.1 hypothetical protein [Candidatus Neomarinimicrobiota bacterium]MBT3896620.1 hypothetical protein [Candidatus Neomarinimicrobiota bacterium]
MAIIVIPFLFCQILFSTNNDDKTDILFDETPIFDPIHVDVVEDEPANSVLTKK